MRICPECKQRTEDRVCPACRITTVDESALSGQDLVGKVYAERYEVVEILGRGGMGAVYKARHIAMDSMVALKVLRREASGDLDSIERFYREARSASRLQHPNTIRVFDFGQAEDGQLFLAMECLEGRTLRSEVRRVGRMDEARVLHVAEQVARSLGEAHGKGIIHRDVKPENVFLTEMLGHPDFVKVLDFGVARTLSNESMTRTGLAIGTPAYMSPEQARGEKVDGRSDLYSLGVIMFEMAAGIPPFESSTPMHLMLKHLSEAPPRLTDICGGGVTPAFEALVLQLLAKTPDERPADAQSLLDRIAQLKPTVHTPRETTATMVLGTDAPTPVRNGSTAFLGSPEPQPTPTTPMRMLDASHGAGPSRNAVRVPAPNGGSNERVPTTQPMAATARTALHERPTSGADFAAVARRRGWVAPAVLGAAVALALAGAGTWWLLHASAPVADALPGASPLPAPAPTPLPPPPAAPTPAPAARPAAAPAAVQPAVAVAPPAPTPPRAPARARLSGTPDGAKVVRLPDGAPLGRLPLQVEVAPGSTVRVRVSAPGYRSVEMDLAWDDLRTTPDRAVKLSRKTVDSDGGWDL